MPLELCPAQSTVGPFGSQAACVGVPGRGTDHSPCELGSETPHCRPSAGYTPQDQNTHVGSPRNARTLPELLSTARAVGSQALGWDWGAQDSRFPGPRGAGRSTGETGPLIAARNRSAGHGLGHAGAGRPHPPRWLPLALTSTRSGMGLLVGVPRRRAGARGGSPRPRPSRRVIEFSGVHRHSEDGGGGPLGVGRG